MSQLKPEDLIGENGLLKQLTKALVERALDAEMEALLGHAKNDTVTTSFTVPHFGKKRGGDLKSMLRHRFSNPPQSPFS